MSHDIRMYEVQLGKRTIKVLQKYPEKSRELIYAHVRMLNDPYSANGVECLHKPSETYRMHIGRIYTIIFRIHKNPNIVQVLEIDTIEQAHKRYGRYYQK